MTGNYIVDRISKMNFSGNIVPMSWFKNVKLKNGKPDTVAIIILSDIIYWYRASEKRDESTGQVLGHKTKFKADKLQKSYQALADQFGYTKRQVQDAVKRLRDAGIITTELRTVTATGGMKLSNVLFIEPVPDKIEEITYNVRDKQPSHNVAEGVSRYNVIPYTPKEGTYTETTTQNTTKKYNVAFADAKGEFKLFNRIISKGYNQLNEAERYVKYFFDCYERNIGDQHPSLKNEQMERNLEFLYIHLSNDQVATEVIQNYFDTEMDCDYNLNHFCTEGVFNNRIYKTGNY